QELRAVEPGLALERRGNRVEDLQGGGAARQALRGARRGARERERFAALFRLDAQHRQVRERRQTRLAALRELGLGEGVEILRRRRRIERVLRKLGLDQHFSGT